jgi:YD repeat-containing protein
MNREKLALMKAEFDERGNRVARAYFDDHGQPTEDWTREGLKYDEQGNVVERVFQGADGKPLRTSLGYAGWTARYDGRGRCVGAAYFDQDRKPVPTRLVIVAVDPGTQAAQLRLQAGDAIESFEGKPAEGRWWFLSTRSAERTDEPPKEMVILRKGRRLTFSVKPGRLGVTLEDRALAAPAEGP